MNINHFTMFFVKPTHFDISDDIIDHLQQMLEEDFRIDYRSQPKTSSEFWADFYRKIESVNRPNFQYMVDNYPLLSEGKIDLVLLSGNRITQRVKEISGPTRYEDNPSDTVRGRFGPYELPNTIVHSPKPREVPEDMTLLKRYSLI